MNPDVSTILSNPSATIITLPNGKQGYSIPKTITAVQIENEIASRQAVIDSANQEIEVLQQSLAEQQKVVAGNTDAIAQLKGKLAAIQPVDSMQTDLKK